MQGNGCFRIRTLTPPFFEPQALLTELMPDFDDKPPSCLLQPHIVLHGSH